MTAPPAGIVVLDNCFASDLPDLTVPWQAETPPEAAGAQRAAGARTRPGPSLAAQARRNRPAHRHRASRRRQPDDANPVAQVYAGHQFGNYVQLLGDGRALLHGELEDAQGLRRDVHLKGSGRTPFARGGDGLAAVGPMLREYIVSEALDALRIRTTRSLAVIATGRDVRREHTLLVRCSPG